MYSGMFVKKSTPSTDNKKKKPVGSIVFYSIYGAFVLACIIAIAALISPLKNWLVNYEASQPDTVRQQVFDEYFAQPQWEKLYELAGIQDTPFEGKDAFVTYMTEKLAKASNPTLVCQETSAGLSGNHKYLIKLDDETIATFILEPDGESRGEVTGWKLGGVELYFTREHSVTIEKLPGQIVTVNGVTLDDSYTTRITGTKAEDYLPDGLHGFQSESQTVTGLLVVPQVTLTDAAGQSVTLTADPETGVLRPEGLSTTMEVPDAHKDIAITAAKNYALFAIRKISSGTLAQYFDSGSQLYKDVISTSVFLKAIASYDFRNLGVEDYYCYSDDLFSARVLLTMDVHTVSGYTKVFEINTTFFFKKNSSGTFRVISSTNVDTTQRMEQVRLSFFNGEEAVESMMVSATSNTLTLPRVSAPAGKVFKGWAVKSIDANGNTQMTIQFTPDENGIATIAPNQTLEPMVLYAVFGAAE